MEPSISNFIDALSKVVELVDLLEKDFSGVRVRSPSVLLKEELLSQVTEVIQKIKEDILVVESGIKDLKTWFMVRKQALNGITNLHDSLKKTLEQSKSVEEIKDSVRMFSLSAQEDFVHNLLRLENLWNERVFSVTQAMNRVLSIMLVTQEKIGRYKKQLALNENDLSNYLEKILKSIIEKDLANFSEIEKKFRENIIHGE
ncbi:MAG: hypothetical protein ACTSRG_00545 [Candidatus Helarchaeota archaeon]